MTLRRDAGAAGRDNANWRFRQKGTEGQSVGNDTNIGADADQLNFINLFLIVFFRKIPGKLGAAKCFFTENGALMALLEILKRRSQLPAKGVFHTMDNG